MEEKEANIKGEIKMKKQTRKTVASIVLAFAILAPLGKAWSYLFAPVNCVAKTSVKLVADVSSVLPAVGNDLKEFAECVWGNVTGHSIA